MLKFGKSKGDKGDYSNSTKGKVNMSHEKLNLFLNKDFHAAQTVLKFGYIIGLKNI